MRKGFRTQLNKKDSVKNHTDVLIFHTRFIRVAILFSEGKQIAVMADANLIFAISLL